VLLAVPVVSIALVARSVTSGYLQRLLEHLGTQLNPVKGSHSALIELHTRWVLELLQAHSTQLHASSRSKSMPMVGEGGAAAGGGSSTAAMAALSAGLSLVPTMRLLHKGFSRQQQDLTALCDENKYLLDYLCGLGKLQKKQKEEEGEEEEEEAE
jgi:hypothetical protein